MHILAYMARVFKKNYDFIENFLVLIIAISIVFLCGFSAYRFVEKKYIYPLKYSEQIISISNHFGVDSALIFAIIKVESSFDKNSLSKKGAKGLMQITSSTAKYIATNLNEQDYDLFDSETNIRFGVYYIKYLINKFENEKTAIIAYNAGEGNVSAWLKEKEYSTDGKTLKSIPFKESEKYLIKVEKSLRKYKNLYGKILDK